MVKHRTAEDILHCGSIPLPYFPVNKLECGSSWYPNNLMEFEGFRFRFICCCFTSRSTALGHIATGSFTGGGNQCILHCKPPGHRQVTTNFPT